jgi:6-phosphogluconolactonase
VPRTDAASNFRMASEALLGRVPIPPSNVHRVEGELPPVEAAMRYEAVLGDAPLDLVLLGMGDDGHVASLFPGGPELASSDRRVVTSRAPVAPHDRVSLALSVICDARVVALLVTGAAKAARLREVHDERARGEPRLPAARVAPQGGGLHWFLDAAAASLLPLASTKEERS